jgi:hypothetical protein
LATLSELIKLGAPLALIYNILWPFHLLEILVLRLQTFVQPMRASSNEGSGKYAPHPTFCIETGDDPDNFSSDDMERGAASKKQNGNVKQAAGANGKHTQAELVKEAAYRGAGDIAVHRRFVY